jgi:hypothetical protein
MSIIGSYAQYLSLVHSVLIPGVHVKPSKQELLPDPDSHFLYIVQVSPPVIEFISPLSKDVKEFFAAKFSSLGSSMNFIFILFSVLLAHQQNPVFRHKC